MNANSRAESDVRMVMNIKPRGIFLMC